MFVVVRKLCEDAEQENLILLSVIALESPSYQLVAQGQAVGPLWISPCLKHLDQTGRDHYRRSSVV